MPDHHPASYTYSIHAGSCLEQTCFERVGSVGRCAVRMLYVYTFRMSSPDSLLIRFADERRQVSQALATLDARLERLMSGEGGR